MRFRAEPTWVAWRSDDRRDMPRVAGALDQWMGWQQLGATVLDSRIRLHWTSDTTPLAVLSADEIDPVEALVGFLAGSFAID